MAVDVIIEAAVAVAIGAAVKQPHASSKAAGLRRFFVLSTDKDSSNLPEERPRCQEA